MACFIVPVAEAAVATIAAKVAEKKEKEIRVSEGVEVAETTRIPFSRKLKWLTYMLWGGCVLLAFEHIWHGEVVPWFPFLTAAGNPADAAEMLHEMVTVGVAMAVLVTLVWCGIVAVVSAMEKRAAQEPIAEKQ